MVSSLLALLLLTAASASAETIVLSGSFAATDETPAEGVPASISGAWTSQPFDTASVPPSGGMDFTIGLASLSFAPSPYSANTTFGITNSGVLLAYRDGVLAGLLVGGLVSSIDGISSSHDDFVVGYITNRPASIARWSAAEAGEFNDAAAPGTVSGEFVIAPEPSVLPWLALSALGLVRRQSLRR